MTSNQMDPEALVEEVLMTKILSVVVDVTDGASSTEYFLKLELMDGTVALASTVPDDDSMETVNGPVYLLDLAKNEALYFSPG